MTQRPRRLLAGTLVAAAAVAVLGACQPSPTGGLPDGSSTHLLTVGSVTRSYRTYVPAGLDRSAPNSLVVMLHGGFGSAKQAEDDYGWDQMADIGRVVVAYPDGENRSWNAGTCCGPAAEKGVDDVEFVSRVVAAIDAKIPLDPHRIFVTGMSNGAMMAQRLACETNLFAGVASVAGAEMVPCEHPSAASVLHVHGTADDHVPIDGTAGHGVGNVPLHTPVATSVAKWRTVDGCGSPVVTMDGPTTTDATTCPSGRAVTLITIDGAGHQWPGSTKVLGPIRRLIGGDPPSTALDATEVIWQFFAEHPGEG